MTWENIYLTCFVVGFVLAAMSFVLGNFHLHLPHLHFDGFHFHTHVDMPHIHTPHMHVPHAGGAPVNGASGGGQAAELPWFNFGTLSAFLAWFGGAGYLLSRYYGFFFWTTFALSVVAGFVGASLIFWFVGKVLIKHDRPLDPADYHMIGVLGTLTVPIREGGTGELTYSQEGVRRCCGARSENGTAIQKSTEVVVTRYERGIAYVRRWEELANETEETKQAGA